MAKLRKLLSAVSGIAFALFCAATVAFFGWWGYAITRPLPPSGVVVGERVAVVKAAVIWVLCVQPEQGKGVCRSVSHRVYESCSVGDRWPDCGEER